MTRSAILPQPSLRTGLGIRITGLFFWKDNKKIDAFANAVAEDLYSHIQPEIAEQQFEGIAQQNRKKQRKIKKQSLGIARMQPSTDAPARH